MDHAFDRLYETLSIIAYGLVGVSLITVGFLATYFNLLSQYDRVGTVTMGAIAVGGLVLCFVGFGITYNASRKQARPLPEKNIHTSKASTTSALENAIAVLVLDFVKERELDRETKRKIEKTQDEKTEDIFQEEINIH